MNEIANFCEKVGADVDKVRLGVGTDSRIGKRFLFPGIGYGGSCFPKDVLALHKAGKENSFNFEILEAVLDVNSKQKLVLVDKVNLFYGDSLSGKKFAIWGLAFKPNTDDIREAPAIYMARELVKMGAQVVAFDPEAMPNTEKENPGLIEYAGNMYEALNDADALLIATEWSVFRNPDFEKMAELLKEKVIFDGRNLYDLNTLKETSFYYESIGREVINSDVKNTILK